MRWPWTRQVSDGQLVVSWSDQTLVYVLARPQADGVIEVLKFGVERQGEGGVDELMHRLQALGLKGLDTRIMLRPQQYQWMQIDAPAVPPEELRAAARYQVREMLLTHVDDVTLDVMRVGDEQQKGKGHLFVVAATNAVLRSVLELGQTMHWAVSVIDVQETAQRNLQSALVAREGAPERANAALVLVDAQEAVLTICAHEELFYTRRFELPEGLLTAAWGEGGQAVAGPAEGFIPVAEYVPGQGGAASAPAGGDGSDKAAQRLLVEVQRSLDVWDRSWSSLPLAGLRVYAGARSVELARWLSSQLGQAVLPLEPGTLFSGFTGGATGGQAQCLPLLGILLRSESR